MQRSKTARNHLGASCFFNSCLRMLLSVAFALSVCWPVTVTGALAQAEALPSLVADGGQGAVIITLDQSQATETANALGARATDATSGEADAEAAIDADELSANGVTWEVLMSVDSDAAQATAESTGEGTSTNADSYLIVRATSQTSSADALITWANQLPGVVAAEEDDTFAIIDDDDCQAETDAILETLADTTDTATEDTSDLIYTETQSLSTLGEVAWFLNNTGAISQGTVGFDIMQNITAETAKAASNKQVVAVIDSGVDYTNAALKDHLVDLSQTSLAGAQGVSQYEYCAEPSTVNDTPDQFNMHGTHVAGIVLQTSSLGNTDASGAQILAIRAGDSSGSFSTAALFRSLNFVIKAKTAGINVVATNMSLGNDDYYSFAMRAAIIQINNAGIAVSTAAGNETVNVDEAAYSSSSLNLPGTLAVGATNSTGATAYYSCYGQRNVDVFAPGSTITSTIPETTSSARFTNLVAYSNALNGTQNGSQAILYEGFEDYSEGTSGATAENTAVEGASFADDIDVGSCLDFTYGKYTPAETFETANGISNVGTISGTNTAIKTTTDGSYTGASAGIIGALTDSNNAIVSREITQADLAAGVLQTWDLTIGSASENLAGVIVGFLDENNNFYIGENFVHDTALSVMVVGMRDYWSSTTSQSPEIIPAAIRADLKQLKETGQANHTYRIAVACISDEPAYVDSFAVGYGLEGMGVTSGTSMAAPVVAGLMAIAAENYVTSAAGTEAFAAEICARVCGGTQYAENLEEMCATSGNVTVAGLAEPSPAPQTITINNNATATIDGYFYGAQNGSVKIDGQDATVLKWSYDATTGKSSVTAILPASVSYGSYNVEITSADTADAAATGQRQFFIDARDATRYKSLATTIEATEGDNPTGAYYASLSADAIGVYLLEGMFESATYAETTDSDSIHPYRLLRYSYTTDTWETMAQDYWSNIDGLPKDAQPTYTTALRAGDQTYFVATYEASDDNENFGEGLPGQAEPAEDPTTISTCFILKWDDTVGKLVKVCQIDGAEQVVSDGATLYCVGSDQVDGIDVTTISTVDTNNGQTTLLGNFSDSFYEAATTETVEPGTASGQFGCSAVVAGGYFVIAAPFTDDGQDTECRIFKAALSDLSPDKVTDLTVEIAPYKMTKAALSAFNFAPAGKYVAISAVQTSTSGDEYAHAVLYDPESGEWIVTPSAYTLYEPAGASTTYYNQKLYVWSRIDAGVDTSTELFSSLSIAAYEPEVDVAAPVFADVDYEGTTGNAWATQWIEAAAKAGLMCGYDSGDAGATKVFGVNNGLTRAEAITVLYRAATGATADDRWGYNNTQFSDVATSAFYTNALNWAVSNGYVTGYAGTTEFKPDTYISRQELATMIWRTAGKPEAADAGVAYASCVDAGSELAYATDAIKWTASVDIMSGKVLSNGTKQLDPFASTTRAEAAKMFVQV